MSAGAIGGTTLGTGNAAEAAGRSAGSPFAAIDSSDFMRILISELGNQDPFSPQDSAALLEQLSSIRSIESQVGLQQKLEALVLQNQVSVAGGLIGRVVWGLDGSNRTVSGQVLAVVVQDGAAKLELDSGHLLPMDRITRVGTSGGAEG